MTHDRTSGSPARSRSSFTLGSFIGIGAGMGLTAGILFGDLASGLMCGAAAGTLAGSVAELYRPPPPHAGLAPRPTSLRSLLGCLIFLGVSALFGSVLLLSSPSSEGGPSGAWSQIPLSVLEYSPFTTFLIPGLILGLVFGVGSFGAVLALRSRPTWPLGTALTRFTGEHWAWSAAVAVGLGQIIWIVTETVMLRGASWLGAVYGSLGVLIVVLAFRPEVRAFLALTRTPGVPHGESP